MDNSDHWEFADKTICRVNFLKVSDPTFKWTCLNGQNYQNRLRHSEYRDMLRQAGFEIIREEREVDSRSLAAVEKLPISARFSRFSHEDLATIGSFLLGKRVD